MSDLGHDLYETGDIDAPESIKDFNGEVVLGLCRKCGKGEAELSEPCSGVTSKEVPSKESASGMPSKEDFENAYVYARKLIEGCDDEAIVNLSMEYNKVSDGYSNGQVDLAMARFMGIKLSCHPDPTVGLIICNLLIQWMLDGAVVANKKESENATKQ